MQDDPQHIREHELEQVRRGNHAPPKQPITGRYQPDPQLDADKIDTAKMRRAILEDAIRCVCADRNKAYGAPENNFQVIADYWNVLLADKLAAPITAHDVGMAMTLMKIARMKTSPDKADHYVDAAGYLACTGGFTAGPAKV